MTKCFRVVGSVSLPLKNGETIDEARDRLIDKIWSCGMQIAWDKESIIDYDTGIEESVEEWNNETN